MPTEKELGYKSSVGIYGGKLNYDEENKMIFDMRGVISKIDQTGDAILRTYDEHIAKNLISILKNHPRLFFHFLAPGTKRYRGLPEEIAANIKKLHLDDAYAQHDWGIEIKNQEIYKKGRPLQDIYRADAIGADDLSKVDRFQALTAASEYIGQVHQNGGSIGEVLPSDIIFQDMEAGVVKNPILNIPDIIYNQKKEIGDKEQKATDLLDFTMSIGFEELRHSQDWNEVEKAIKIIIENYKDKNVISLLKSYIKRGRLTLQGDEKDLKLSKFALTIKPLASQHNKARLNFDKDITNNLRELIIKVCDEYLG